MVVVEEEVVMVARHLREECELVDSLAKQDEERKRVARCATNSVGRE